MNLPRIRELQDFSDSFNLKISQAIERYDNHINELNRPVKTVPSCFSAPKKIKISKKKYSNDIFKEPPPPWKDPKHHGRYFDKLSFVSMKEIFSDNISNVITGFFNMVSSDISVEDMFKLNNYAIEYLMCVCVDVNDCVKYFNEKMYVSFDSQFKEMMMKGIQRLKGKLKERSDVCKIMKEYDLIMEGVVDGAKKELCVE